jgi:hypothetical protein
MTIKQLNKKLNDLLQDYLKKEDFVDTGSLHKSIKFDCKFNQQTFDFEVEFRANEYILYLDKGDLIQDFLNEEKTERIIAEFIASQVTLQ